MQMMHSVLVDADSLLARAQGVHHVAEEIKVTDRLLENWKPSVGPDCD